MSTANSSVKGFSKSYARGKKRRTIESKTVSYNHHAGIAACSHTAPATSTSRSSTGQQAHQPEPQDHGLAQHPSDALGVVATPRGDPQKICQAAVRHLATLDVRECHLQLGVNKSILFAGGWPGSIPFQLISIQWGVSLLSGSIFSGGRGRGVQDPFL